MVEKKKTDVIDPQYSRRRVPRWAWPLGLAAAGLGTAATVFMRGCWHSHMSWPIKAEGEHEHEYSYQVCTDCGMKRLFDERSFRAYGPFSYELHELIALERLDRKRRIEKAQKASAGREGLKPVPVEKQRASGEE